MVTTHRDLKTGKVVRIRAVHDAQPDTKKLAKIFTE
jgi:hypothetical protein